MVPFFTMPILTRYLSPEQYGLIAIYVVYTAIIGSLVGVSTLTAFTKIYYDEKYENRSYLSISILVSLLSALILFILVYVSGDYIADLYSIQLWWLYVGVILVFFENIISVQTLLYRMKSKVFKFGLFQLCRVMLRAGITIYLVVAMDFEENGPIISGIITASIFMVISIYVLYTNRSLSLHPNLEYAKHALRFGIPLTPHVLFGALSTTIDKIVIAIMLTKEELGIYAVGFAIGGLIKSLEGAVYIAYQPWFFQEISSDKCDNKKIRNSSYLILIGLLLSSLTVILISNIFLQYYVGERFLKAVEIIPWIAIAFAINGIFTMANQVVMYKEKTGVISLITFSSVLLGVFLNYILIGTNGLVGAAQAILLLMSIRALTMWIYSNRLYPLG